ncbi:MAG: hypothetical protein QW112_02175, partial [Candidatus Micrarchaeia archaeon]
MLRMVSGDEGLERALGCYLKKIREEETVSFLLCKSVKIDIEKQEEDRWKLHGEGLKELKYLKERNIHPSELERLQGQGRYGFSLL